MFQTKLGFCAISQLIFERGKAKALAILSARTSNFISNWRDAGAASRAAAELSVVEAGKESVWSNADFVSNEI